jgi:MFS family permease
MTSIGLMFAVGILVYGFASPASGWLSDRLGRIQVMNSAFILCFSISSCNAECE